MGECAPEMVTSEDVAHTEEAIPNDSKARGQATVLARRFDERVPEPVTATEPPHAFDLATSETTCGAPNVLFHTNR